MSMFTPGSPIPSHNAFSASHMYQTLANGFPATEPHSKLFPTPNSQTFVTAAVSHPIPIMHFQLPTTPLVTTSNGF